MTSINYINCSSTCCWGISNYETWFQSNDSSLIRYLVCVAEFTDLSGNQVSLVILHLHGIDILLAQRQQRQKETTLNILHFWKMSDNQRTCDRCEQYLLFLLFPLLVAGLTVGVLRGRIELACILSDQDVYCPFYDLVPPKGFLIENLLLILVLVLWAAAGPLWVKTERWEKLWTCYSAITKATGFSFTWQHTPLALLFLAFHSSSWALVLASTLTNSFLSPKSNSCRSRRARSVDSGSLYSQNPKASRIWEWQENSPGVTKQNLKQGKHLQYYTIWDFTKKLISDWNSVHLWLV